MSRLSRLVFLGVLALSVPTAWSDEASSAPAATAEAPAPGQPPAPAAPPTGGGPPAAGTPPAAAAAPTEPTLMGVDKISAGDTAWMLTSTALVLMMSIPGLALFYGGEGGKRKELERP